MASVVLTDVWLHLVDDMDEYLRLPFVTRFQRRKSVEVTVTKMASGRLVAKRREGSRRQWELGLQALTRPQIGWLEDHLGETMMVRDNRSNLVYAVCAESPFDEHTYNEEADVTLTFNEVTHSPEAA